MAGPIRVAVLDDYEIIVQGVASMLRPFTERVEIVETDTDGRLAREAEVSLFDSFAQGEADSEAVTSVLGNARTGRVVMYTWNLDDALVERARRRGFAGYLSKGLAADALVASIERVAAGEFVVDGRGSDRWTNPSRPFPGRDDGLTEREAEVLALIAQGRSNSEISEVLYLSYDGTKSRVRRTYRKLGLANRKDAIRWALSNGFRADPDD